MSSFLTSEDIIESAKRRASIPESQVTFQREDFLDIANEEMAIGLVPTILQFHEEYFVYAEDVPLVSGQLRYPIPYRAIGNRLRQISFLDSAGSEFEMTRIDPEYIFDFSSAVSASWPRRFKIEGGDVVIQAGNTSTLTGTLRLRYFLRPNNLVTIDRGAQIASIDTNTGLITFTAPCPDHFSSSLLYDFNRTKSDHRILAFDIPIISVGTSSITLDPTDIPSNLVVGDYVCQAGETVIPNIPTDLHVVLAHRVAARCLEALGDTQGLQNANAKLQEMEVRTGSLIDNRVEGSPQKVINRTSSLRNGLWRRWRRPW